MAETLSRSRHHIHVKAKKSVDAKCEDLSNKLQCSTNELNVQKEKSVALTGSLLRPLKEDEIKWGTVDGSQSGSTELGRVMKSFKKSTCMRERELAQQQIELSRIDAAIHDAAKNVLGHAHYQRVVTGELGKSDGLNEEYQQMQMEIELERKRMMMQIEEANTVASDALKEIEKV